MYHRIGPVAWDPWQICVQPAHFAEHLDALVKTADIVPLAELNGRLRTRRQGRPVVALTFDDGYADNLHVALPLLERYQVPATIFVATAWIDRHAPFWWDQLTGILQSCDELPAELPLKIGRREFVWRGPGARRDHVCKRDALHFDLWNRLVTARDDDRAGVMLQLEHQLGSRAVVDSGIRPMSREELRRVAASPLIEIGTHGKNHISLPDLSPLVRFEEIAGSREQCEQLIGTVPSSFAFPFGRSDRVSWGQVKKAGFSRACGSHADLVWDDAHPWFLPRMHVPDFDGADFSRRLRWAWLP